MFRWSTRFVAAAALALFAGPALGGTVYLEGGSVVHGEILRLKEDGLKVATDFAGDIVIDKAAVAGVATSGPVVVRFDNGDVLHGRLAFEPGGQLRLVDTKRGGVAVAWANVAGLRPPGTPSPEEMKIAALRENRWSGRLLIGVSGSSGNNESRDISLGLEITRKARKGRLYIDLYLDRGREAGELTTAQFVGTLRLEHDFSKRFFLFAQTQVERDEFANVDFRSTTTVGPGYYFILDKHQKLKGRLGLGYEYVQPETDVGRVSEAIVTVGYDYQVDLWPAVTFKHELTFIPRMSDQPLNNYRIDAALGLEAALGEGTGWSLLAQYRLAYNSDPEAGLEGLDSSYVLNLVRAFE